MSARDDVCRCKHERAAHHTEAPHGCGLCECSGFAEPLREQVATYGTPRRRDYVRVFVDTLADARIVRAQFRHPKTGKLKTESFGTDTKASRAAAKKFGESMTVRLRSADDALPARITVAELGEKYLAATLPNLRKNTKRNYEQQWKAFVDFVGEATKADAIRLTHLDELRAHYRAKEWEHATIREVIATAKRAWKWAEGRELLTKNRLYAYTYRIAKDERKGSPDEYSVEEFNKIVGALDPQHGGQWRAFVALTICGAQGARSHAVLHLRWPDVDLEAGVITWRAEWDKNGEEWTQPLRAATRAALTVAAMHAERKGLDSEWVIPAGSSLNRDGCYDATSLWRVLKHAEGRAGVERKARRGAHGLRRMVAGEVWELTGDMLLGLQAIGDKDVKMAARYLKKRDRRIHDAFGRLDAKPDGAAD